MDTNEMDKMPNPIVLSPMTKRTSNHKQNDEDNKQKEVSRTNQMRNHDKRQTRTKNNQTKIPKSSTPKMMMPPRKLMMRKIMTCKSTLHPALKKT